MTSYLIERRHRAMVSRARRAGRAKSLASAATSKRDEAYSLAINSDDELFHTYLYDWHVTRHLQEQLLEVGRTRES